MHFDQRRHAFTGRPRRGERPKLLTSPFSEDRQRRLERVSDLYGLHGSRRMLRNGCAHVLTGPAESARENCAVSVRTAASVWDKIGEFQPCAPQFEPGDARHDPRRHTASSALRRQDYGSRLEPAGQRLEDEQQIAFSRFYGPLEVSPGIGRKSAATSPTARIRHREIFDISNLDQDGGILGENNPRASFMLGNQLWHTDSSFRRESATWSMLHGKAFPPAGGDTEFAD